MVCLALRSCVHLLDLSADPSFIDAFLLIYCRFVTPQDLLLAFFAKLKELAKSVVISDTQEFAVLRYPSSNYIVLRGHSQTGYATYWSTGPSNIPSISQ